MTLKGAIFQLQELQDAEDMPTYYKPCLKEVIHTIETDAIEINQDLISRQMVIEAIQKATVDGDKVDWCIWVIKRVPIYKGE